MNETAFLRFAGYSALFNAIVFMLSLVALMIFFSIGGIWGRINDSLSIIWMLSYLPLAVALFLINRSVNTPISLISSLVGIAAALAFAVMQILLVIGQVRFEQTFAAMRAGARGYILKGADQEEMLRAIRAVAQGEALFGPDIATRLMNFFSSPQSELSPQAFPELTSREHEVLDLIAKGINNQAIASRLSISEKTVRNHISNIFNKLQVVDRAQAIVKAREAGMGR